MSSEKDFIEFLIFMNKFVFLWELLKYSPDSWESYSIVEDEKTLCCSLVDKDGNEITDDILDNFVEISLNSVGKVFYERYISGEFFKKEEIAEIIRDGLNFKYL